MESPRFQYCIQPGQYYACKEWKEPQNEGHSAFEQNVFGLMCDLILRSDAPRNYHLDNARMDV